MHVQSAFAVIKTVLEPAWVYVFLRSSLALSLFLKHGVEKITGFERMLYGFPDPLHIGALLSLSVATASDVVAATFLILGFATRPSAFFAASIFWSPESDGPDCSLRGNITEFTMKTRGMTMVTEIYKDTYEAYARVWDSRTPDWKQLLAKSWTNPAPTAIWS